MAKEFWRWKEYNWKSEELDWKSGGIISGGVDVDQLGLGIARHSLCMHLADAPCTK